MFSISQNAAYRSSSNRKKNEKSHPSGWLSLRELLGSLGSALGLGFTLVDLLLVVDREEHGGDGDDEEADGDRVMGDGHEVAAVEVHEADEVLLAHRSENESEQDRAERELKLVHQPTHDAEDHADAQACL